MITRLTVQRPGWYPFIGGVHPGASFAAGPGYRGRAGGGGSFDVHIARSLTSPTPAGFPPRTTTTDSAGVYAFTGVPAERNYTVTPEKSGYQFMPTSKSLTNLSANQVVNFLVKVYSISGRVTRTGTTTAISAVTVTLTSPTPSPV